MHAAETKNIKSQKVKNLKLTSHEEYDKSGKLKVNKYVEFMVVGKNRTWPDFMTIKDFKKLNPSLEIKN